MKSIGLCGSMKVKDKILKLGSKLEKMGFEVLYPVECMKGLPKKIASKAHFDRIKASDAVLIVNEKAHDVSNYIGPNSFAEIAFGFYFEKEVYLLNDYYEPYLDELEGWEIKVLKGDLELIKKD